MAKIKLGIVGIGKIARDQHLPVVAASDDFELVGVASRHASVDGVASFPDLQTLLTKCPHIEAISLCTPPAPRARDALLALSAGRHVMLEKPPGATLSEVDALANSARRNELTLYASWHSRHAPGVAPAREWLAQRKVTRVIINWKEDIRVWHPGQDWILEPGGLGVFDPGINALSILTAILPLPFALMSADLVFPTNRQAPIAATLAFRDTGGALVDANLDFLYAGAPMWEIRVETDNGVLMLADGGARLSIDGATQAVAAHGPHIEYEGVYREFAGLVRTRQSQVDVSPLRHVADAFMLGRRIVADAFSF